MEPPNNPRTGRPARNKPLKSELFPWDPRPLESPIAARDLVRLGSVERSAEVIRYSVRRGEYWLSPKGGLREWFRLNLWVATILAIPAIVTAPIASYLLTQVAAQTGELAQIARNLAGLPGSLRTGIIIVAIMAAMWILRFLFR